MFCSRKETGMGKHIVIAGKRHVGKTTLVNRLLDDTDCPIYGFRTAPGRSMKKGFRSFFIFPAGSEGIPETEENHIGDGAGGAPQGYPEVFDTYGVRCLEAEPGGIIVMDELGFFEKDAKVFCSKVLELFDGDIPIVATVKTGHDIDILNKVINHPNADVYYINEENRDELYERLRAGSRQTGGEK